MKNHPSFLSREQCFATAFSILFAVSLTSCASNRAGDKARQDGTTVTLGTLGGAAVGALVDRKDPVRGAVVGGALGNAAAKADSRAYSEKKEREEGGVSAGRRQRSYAPPLEQLMPRIPGLF